MRDADSGTEQAQILSVSRWQLIKWRLKVQATEYVLLLLAVGAVIVLAIYF